MPKKTATAAAAGAPKAAPVKITLLTSLKAIDAAILSLHERGQSLQTDMHIAACSVLAHVGKHRDIRVMHKLLNAMPDVTRNNSLRLWFETFGNVKFEGKDIVLTDNGIKLADAMKKPFWKFKANEGVPYEAIDVAALLASTIKKLERDSKETKIDHSAVIHALRNAATIPSGSVDNPHDAH
jgi:hypothetical protein